MKHLIIIPAFQEEAALADTLAGLQMLPDNFEIVVVNDGSLDGTGQVAERAAAASKLRLHVVHLAHNGGIGAAMQTGYLFCARRGIYHYAIQFDADGQHDAGAVAEIVRASERAGLDLCIGSRFLDPVRENYRSTFARRVGIRFVCALIRVLSGLRTTDPTSGFRCAGPRAWAQFAERYPDDYAEPESLFWCARNRMKIGEIPVRMHERQGGVSSIRRLGMVYYLLKVSLAIMVDRLRRHEYRDHAP